jgi:hypothetical protein
MAKVLNAADFAGGLRGHMQMNTLVLRSLMAQNLLHFSDVATNEIFHYRAIIA